MSLKSLLIDDGPTDFYDASFRSTLEDLMLSLRQSKRLTPVSVTPIQGVVYEGDLFGLLQDLRVPAHLHWVTMRINNYASPYDYSQDKLLLYVPNDSELESIRQSWRTRQKK